VGRTQYRSFCRLCMRMPSWLLWWVVGISLSVFSYSSRRGCGAQKRWGRHDGPKRNSDKPYAEFILKAGEW
jgi:hypothetical protein